MKITILSQYYQRSASPGISLLADTAAALSRNGHAVRVVAGRYGYMDRRKFGARQNPWSIVYREQDGEIEVFRTNSGNEESRSRLRRIISYFLFTFTCIAGLFAAGRPHVVLASSPPLFPALTAWVYARIVGAKLVLEIRDLWPEAVVTLGVVRNRMIIRATETLEVFLYRHADAVIALTNGVAEGVRHKTPSANILVARCAVERPTNTNTETREAVRRDQGWSKQVVALYAGTLGYANDLSIVLQAADALRNYPHLCIVLIGDGVYRHELELEARRLDLANVKFLPPLSRASIWDYYAAADIGLCTLSKCELFEGAVPTKLVDYAAAGLPIVAPRLREIESIVSFYDCGRLYSAGSPEALAQTMLDLADHPELRQRLGERSRCAAANEFSIDERTRRVESFLFQVCGDAEATAV
ncbi:glycosyltransferase family 4 protein [Ferruginivarius sediminum]|uniref:Glycosyltransferase WbuB n=1 Tax=Ferruginivarius sediminum TaxID=2661937 RepID=A0A369T5K0_9PROT|nr:glycosyltransferase family 4 protein [Ferruginivarius sediminum]RDD60182.1 glycosyltransferase WbuB [Ferruginivarius sediminum]